MFISVVTPTHDPKYLPELWTSLEAQTLKHRWEWVIAPTRACAPAVLAMEFAKSPRVRVVPYPGLPGNVGAAKLWAFNRAMQYRDGVAALSSPAGALQVLLELDHDDLLHPRALELVEAAFEKDEQVGFVYSDSIDWSPTGALVTYHDPARRKAWAEEGWRFDHDVKGRDYPLSFEPSALALSTIFHAPNHLRAWRRDVYQAVDGHDPSRKICDDHDLLVRTYLATRMHRIAEPLYLYRVDGENTWLKNVHQIREATYAVRDEHLHALVAREMQLRGLPCLDLGGGIDPAGAPWIPVDVRFNSSEKVYVTNSKTTVDFEACRWPIYADLMQLPWPFATSSVGAFRAFDLLEHLPDRLATMREIYRCLAPGGWLLSRTPSCAGPGAFRDPTHVSLWVRDSFRYYTERALGLYLPPNPSGEENPRFMACRLTETADELPYITADLVSLKDDDGSLPGRRAI